MRKQIQALTEGSAIATDVLKAALKIMDKLKKLENLRNAYYDTRKELNYASYSVMKFTLEFTKVGSRVVLMRRFKEIVDSEIKKISRKFESTDPVIQSDNKVQDIYEVVISTRVSKKEDDTKQDEISQDDLEDRLSGKW